MAQKMTIFNLSLLVLVLVFSTESMAYPAYNADMLRDQCLSPLKKYDERLLVLQWPPSVPIRKDPNTQMSNYKFTVHGLWFNMDSKPVFCTLSNGRITLQVCSLSLLRLATKSM